MRQNNKADMTITEQFESIKKRMCDNYCKFPEMSKLAYGDTDEALERLMESYCNHCPLQEL